METTNMLGASADRPSLCQLLVQQEGYPSQLAGYGPDELAYWVEPTLSWVGAQAEVKEQDTTAISPALIGPWLVWNDEMAPRFLAGTTLAGRLLTSSDAVVVGQVLAWLTPGRPGNRFELARVQAVEPEHLLLRCDHSGRSQQLTWGPGAGTERVYLVTHYVSQPFAWTRLLPAGADAPTGEAYLLQVTDNRMGPRYPVGARYWCRSVPQPAWVRARGVHALGLRDGRQLLARLVSRHRAHLVVSFDGTSQPEQVALADVVHLWKVGAADYLPEETPDEHHAMLQRRGY